MRVGLVVPGFSANGDDWCIPALRHLTRQLSAADELRVVALRYPYRRARYAIEGVQVIALGGGASRSLGSLALWRAALKTLAAEHRRQRFDVLHAFWATETGALAAVAGRLLGVPVLVSLAGGELVALRDIGYGGQLAWSERMKVGLALRLASGVTAGSQAMLALAAPWVRARPASCVQRIPLGVDTRLFRPPPSASAGHLVRLVHVASLVPVKAQTDLLSAAAILRDAGLKFRLDIAGDGALGPELRTLVATLGLDEIVDFCGELPHHELPHLYSAGTAFILSSRHEAQCLAALEAAACGLPIVGTAVGIIPELAPTAAISVPVNSSRALAEAILSLVDSPPHREAMGREARRLVEAEYSLERSAHRFRELYAKVLGVGGSK